MKKSKPKLIIFLVMSLIVVAFVYFLKRETTWKIYSNDRPNYSFRYPSTWSVSRCSDFTVFQQENLIDEIEFSFSKDCPNGPTDSFGYIKVKRIGGVINQVDYINELYKNLKTLIKLEKIGNKTGYMLTFGSNKKLTGSFTALSTEEYFVFYNNLVYQIVLTNPGYKGKAKDNIEIFHKILSSFHFD